MAATTPMERALRRIEQSTTFIIEHAGQFAANKVDYIPRVDDNDDFEEIIRDLELAGRFERLALALVDLNRSALEVIYYEMGEDELDFLDSPTEDFIQNVIDELTPTPRGGR